MAEEISNSKKKRIERKAKNDKNKRDKMIATAISAVIVILFVCFIAFIVYSNVKKEAMKVSPVESTKDFSKGLSDDGKIEGIAATNCVTLPDFAAFKVPQSEVECSDEDVQSIIDETLADNTELSYEEGLEVKDGDKINLDYAGTVDGVAFDGGTAEQYDLVIGSGSFIPGFEDQLVGAKIGENLDVTVTFPEDYQAEDLKGKEAVFNCTVNGIYEEPEFDDDFVKTVLGIDKTAEEYKADKKAEKEEENIKNYVNEHFTEDVTVTEYPKNYLNNVKKVQRYTDIQNYNMMNQFYSQYQGQGFASFEDYIKQVGQAESMTQYYEQLEEEAKNTVRDNLVYQGVADSLQIEVTENDVKASLNSESSEEDEFTTQVEAFGLPYLAQQVLKDKVLEYVCEHAVVE